ncbi:MAG: outer membrane protein assembly factor BamB family protein [Vulcanimicrobiaceae bacterium]
MSVNIASAQTPPSDNSWTMYGHDYSNSRYSPLKQITTENVSRLVPAFVFQTGVVAAFETTPVIDGTMMYITTPFNHAFALNAKTGEKIWEYQAKLGKTVFCCGPVNRGVSIADGTVYMGTLDGRLIALDQQTGKEKWSVQNGDNASGYGITMAPLIYKNMVIVGGAGGEYGVRGTLTAYDRTSHSMVWRWYASDAEHWAGNFSPTTPDGADLHRNIAAEKAAYPKFKNAWQKSGGAVWMTPAVDTDTNTIYATTGNPSPDLLGAVRPGDNLYTDSIVAIDASTGKLKWYYQEIPHDVWDLDAVSPAVLFETVDSSGKTVKAVGQAGKTGWYYVLDRETGKLIRKSDNFVPQENMFAQPTAQGVRMLPGANGGDEWSPISYDPTLHYAFIPALHQPMNYSTKPQQWEKGSLWLGSAFVGIPTEKQYGLMNAVDVNTGKVAWQYKTAQPLIGGSLSTGGGLTFTGEGNGMFDAFDSKTGKLLWQFQCGAGVNSAPMAYEMDGEEYIAVASGGSFQLSYPYGDSLYVFKVMK